MHYLRSKRIELVNAVQLIIPYVIRKDVQLSNPLIHTAALLHSSTVTLLNTYPPSLSVCTNQRLHPDPEGWSVALPSVSIHRSTTTTRSQGFIVSHLSFRFHPQINDYNLIPRSYSQSPFLPFSIHRSTFTTWSQGVHFSFRFHPQINDHNLIPRRYSQSHFLPFSIHRSTTTAWSQGVIVSHPSFPFHPQINNYTLIPRS